MGRGWIENATGLYAADVRIRFDPTVLQVVDMVSVSQGTQIEPLSTLLKPDFVVRSAWPNNFQRRG